MQVLMGIEFFVKLLPSEVQEFVTGQIGTQFGVFSQKLGPI